MSARHVAPVGLILVSLVALFPALPSLDSAVVGDGGDNYQFLGFQNLARRLVAAGQFPFGWTDLWRYPYGIEFQSIYDSTLLILLGLVLYPLIDDPVRVYNASVLLLVLLNVSVSYLSFRTWFRPALAFLGAVVFGLSFYSLAKVGGHVNLLVTAGFPFFASAVYLIHRDRARAGSLARLVLASLLVAFASLQYPLLLLGSLPFLAVLVAAFFPRVSRELLGLVWQRKWGFLLAAVGLVAVFSLFHGRKLLELKRGEVTMPAETITSVPPVNFFVPNSYLPTLVAAIPNRSTPWIENTVFFGYVELLLFVLALFKLERSRVKGFLLSVTAVFFCISLGQPEFLSSLWPYPYLFRHMPYRGVIEPGRFSTFAYLAMTFLILLFLEKVKRQWVWVALGLLLMTERLPRGFYLSPAPRSPELVAAVRSRPTKAVLDLPAYTSWWNGQMYDFYSAYYELPIVLGYVQWSGESYRSSLFVRELRELECFFNPDEAVKEFDPERGAKKRAQVLRELAAHDIRTVVIHEDLFGGEENCGAAHRYVDALFSATEDWEVILETPTKRVLWWRHPRAP